MSIDTLGSSDPYSLEALLDGTHPDIISRQNAVARRALGETLSAQRTGEPSLLSVFAVGEELTLGQIAGRIHEDPRRIAPEIGALADAGIVVGSEDGKRFSISSDIIQ